MSSKWWLVLAASGVLAIGVAACGDDDDSDGGDGGEAVSGSIRIDGSSTVAPLTEAIAEGFNEENGRQRRVRGDRRRGDRCLREDRRRIRGAADRE